MFTFHHFVNSLTTYVFFPHYSCPNLSSFSCFCKSLHTVSGLDNLITDLPANTQSYFLSWFFWRWEDCLTYHCGKWSLCNTSSLYWPNQTPLLHLPSLLNQTETCSHKFLGDLYVSPKNLQEKEESMYLFLHIIKK